MKKYFTLLTLAVAVFSFNFNLVEEARNAAISWALTSYNFGMIEQGTPVSATFSFQNTGDAPVRILEAKASCGCTVASFTKGEIGVGEYGEVSATYNAKKAGVFAKTITVTTNVSGEPIVLNLQGEVVI